MKVSATKYIFAKERNYISKKIWVFLAITKFLKLKRKLCTYRLIFKIIGKIILEYVKIVI
jgi:hypothetical protein